MAGQASGVVGNYIKSSYQNSAKGKTLRRLADHDRRVAGNNPRESRAKRAEQSAKRLQAMVLELQKLQIHQFLVEYRKL